MSSQSELTSKIHDWRYTDLDRIKSALDHAYSSIQVVKDADTAEKFADIFNDLNREAQSLAGEVKSFSGKAVSLKAEMEK